MKIFFQVPEPFLDKDNANKAWRNFLTSLAVSTNKHQIAGTEAEADLIITLPEPSLNSGFRLKQFRPLSRGDRLKFTWDWSDRPTGRFSGLYCSLPSYLYSHSRHRQAPYPLKFNEFINQYPQSDATTDFGFLGGLTAGVRKRVIERVQPLKSQSAFLKLAPTNWSEQFTQSATARKLEYCEFLRKTRFILCPRGYGVGSARVFEALQAGRVPIIISDNYVMPEGIDWPSCSLRIKERDVGLIPELVERNLPQWSLLSENASKIFSRNFSDEAIANYIITQLEQLMGSATSSSTLEDLGYYFGVTRAVAEEKVRPVIGKIRYNLRRIKKSD